ncbi:MAG: aspartate aminotransferase family protein [Deltaproteobacteria bacterium]|nr:MAG: aspartate aminotransferase family protein [Deltaproteobacteria bacterium]
MDGARSKQIQFVPRGGGPPLAIARSEGCTLVTPDGTRILDAAGGAIVMNVGHGRREVAEVAARALEQTAYLVPPFATEGRVALVERLRTHWLPPAITRVAFTSGGSESVDAALRLARQHFVSKGEPGRWKIVGRELSYHGTTLATLGVGGHAKRRAGFEPLFVDGPKAPACYCLRCPLSRAYPGCGVACADEVARVIEREGPESVAAFIAEPVVGSTGGALVPPPEYWPRVAEICRRFGVLFIADEVMCGFGRTGRRFALDHWDVTPDILVGGKGLSGGYAPIGGVFATEAVLAPIAAAGDDFMFFTYGSHPAACAVADKVLEIVEREDLVARAAEMGERLHKALAPLERHPHVAEVRGLGLLRAVELVRDRDTREPFPAEARITQRVVATGLRHGVFFYPGGSDPARDVIVLGPPFTIGSDEIETIAQVLERSIDETVARLQG